MLKKAHKKLQRQDLRYISVLWAQTSMLVTTIANAVNFNLGLHISRLSLIFKPRKTPFTGFSKLHRGGTFPCLSMPQRPDGYERWAKEPKGLQSSTTDPGFLKLLSSAMKPRNLRPVRQ